MGNVALRIKKWCERLFHKHSDLSQPLACNYDQDDDKSNKDCKLLMSSNTKPFDNIYNEVSLQDFKIVKTLGKGSFGKVLLVINLHNRRYFAMKVLKKDMLQKQNQVVHTKTEREILEKITHPFVVKLHYAFQSSEKLFLITDYMPGGELYYHLRKEGCFSEDRARFYACEIILALEYLHKSKIIYRDLKP